MYLGGFSIVPVLLLIASCSEAAPATGWQVLEIKRGRELFGKRSASPVDDDFEPILKRKPSRELFGKRSAIALVTPDDVQEWAFPRNVRKTRELFGKRSIGSQFVSTDYEDVMPMKRARELFGKRGRELFGKRASIAALSKPSNNGFEFSNGSICTNLDDCAYMDYEDEVIDEQLRRLMDSVNAMQQRDRRSSRNRELFG